MHCRGWQGGFLMRLASFLPALWSKRRPIRRREIKSVPASCYSREYFLQVKDQAVFREALRYISRNDPGPFLDMGCGRGEIVLYLARMGKKAIGIDYSPAAIDICQEKLRVEEKSTQDLAEFILRDCQHLPFEKKSFNRVFLIDVVEHLAPQDLKKTLLEAKRVLKEGGLIIIHTNNRYFENLTKILISASFHGLKVFFKIRKTLQEASQNPYEYLHINYLTGDELTRRLKEIGFEVKIEYVKPNRKEEIRKFVDFHERWKRLIFYNIAWVLLNSPLIKLISPTFWIVAQKNNQPVRKADF